MTKANDGNVVAAVQRIIERMGDEPCQNALRRAVEPEITGDHVFDTALRNILGEIRTNLPLNAREEDLDIDFDEYLEFMRTKH